MGCNSSYLCGNRHRQLEDPFHAVVFNSTIYFSGSQLVVIKTCIHTSHKGTWLEDTTSIHTHTIKYAMYAVTLCCHGNFRCHRSKVEKVLVSKHNKIHSSDTAGLQTVTEINTYDYIGVWHVAVLRQEHGESVRQISLLFRWKAGCKHLHICCWHFNWHGTWRRANANIS